MLAFEREGVAWDVIMCGYHMTHTRDFVHGGRNWSAPVEHGGRGVRRIVRAQTTSCYVVNGAYAPTLLRAFTQSVKLLRQAAKLPNRYVRTCSERPRFGEHPTCGTK